MKKREENAEQIQYTGRAFAYVAIGLMAAGLAAFILALVFAKQAGIYLLISSVLLQLASLTFSNVQKRKNNFNYLKIIIICAYVLLALPVLVFIGGIIYAAQS